MADGDSVRLCETVNKGTKIALIVVAVLGLGCLAGMYSMFQNAQSALQQAEEDALTAGDEILALAAGTWDLEAIELRMAPDFGEDVGQENVQNLFDEWNSQIGTLVASELEVTDFQIVSPELLYAKVQGTGDFERGSARVTLELTREPKNSWLLRSIDVTPEP